jgi:hypothetical protein
LCVLLFYKRTVCIVSVFYKGLGKKPGFIKKSAGRLNIGFSGITGFENRLFNRKFPFLRGPDQSTYM